MAARRVVELKSILHVPQIRESPRVTRLFLHGTDPHEHNGGEDRDHRDHNEHFDERKTRPSSAIEE